MNGYIDAAIYVILTAISFVFLGKLCAHVDPVIALFIMSAIGLLCFNLLSIRNLRQAYTACLKHRLTYLAMAAALGVDWVSMLYASYLADPFIAMAALFIALALVGFGKLFMHNRSVLYLISILLLCISLLALFFSYQVKAHQHPGLGILLGFTAGVAFYVYIANSHTLTQKGGLTSMQLLATRFWVLFIGAAICVPYQNLLPVLRQDFLALVLISLGSLVIPIYYNQQAIKKLGAALTSVFISFVPPVTYIFYALNSHTFFLSNAIVCGIITLALVLPNLIRLTRRSDKIA